MDQAKRQAWYAKLFGLRSHLVMLALGFVLGAFSYKFLMSFFKIVVVLVVVIGLAWWGFSTARKHLNKDEQ